MRVSVEVSDEIRRDAESRGMPVIDYLEMLIAKGQEAMRRSDSVSNAIERIRALQAATTRRS